MENFNLLLRFIKIMITLNLKQRQYLLTKDSNLTSIVIINFEQVT